MNRPTADLRLQLTHPTGGAADDRMVNLRIIDTASGVMLIDIRLTSDQFTDLLANRSVEARAAVPTANGLDKAFRERQVGTLNVPTELGSKQAYRSDPEVQQRIAEWAAGVADRESWDEWTVQTGSKEFYATFRRWLPRADS